MGEVISMVFKKSDCQNESVVDLRQHLEPSPDTLERRISAAGALSRCVRLMQEDFGDRFTFECLTNEVLRVKGRK